MDDYDDFSNHPEHINDHLSKDDYRKWTVRDMLVWMLREIDSGRNADIDSAFLAYSRTQGNETFGYYVAGNVPMDKVIGVTELAKAAFIANSSTSS